MHLNPSLKTSILPVSHNASALPTPEVVFTRYENICSSIVEIVVCVPKGNGCVDVARKFTNKYINPQPASILKETIPTPENLRGNCRWIEVFWFGGNCYKFSWVTLTQQSFHPSSVSLWLNSLPVIIVTTNSQILSYKWRQSFLTAHVQWVQFWSRDGVEQDLCGSVGVERSVPLQRWVFPVLQTGRYRVGFSLQWDQQRQWCCRPSYDCCLPSRQGFTRRDVEWGMCSQS